MRDPFPQVSGRGFTRLRQANIEVDIGYEEAAARRLNAPYIKRIATGLPFVTAKWAMTLDGKTATASGASRWITGPRSRALVHELRGRVDGVLVGIETALADDPELSARPAGPRRGARILLDSAARLPLDSRLARTARELPVWIAVTERAPAARRNELEALGCVILPFPGEGTVPIVPLLEALGRRDVTNLLVEGGGKVLGAFLDAGQVDAVDVFIAPLIEGGSHLHTPARGRGASEILAALRLDHHEVSEIDGDVRIQGTIDRPWLAFDPP
jgi:diaminohydroxyphosphoribosylaminopyrimidine deaminase/5-amino-6-(5-phosphoribosylamino)uracil reductase